MLRYCIMSAVEEQYNKLLFETKLLQENKLNEYLERYKDSFINNLEMGIVDLSDRNLSIIPMSLLEMDIRELDLSNNNLGILPDNFGQMQELRELDLSGNQFTTLPDNFGELDNLE